YKGRGIFQLTGRANYDTFGKKLGADFINHPELAADPRYAVLTACEYWNSHSLSTYADRDDLNTITRRINGGTNGIDDRKVKTAAAKAAMGNIFTTGFLK
ncbi:MAG: glycoside hydrolase, partial [Verrucomicrobiaceae bacterium]